jgi:hypothetical protein
LEDALSRLQSSLNLSLCLGADTEDLDGDVVGAAALASEIDQSGARVGWRFAADGRLQFFFGDDAPEAVGAEQEVIAFEQVESLVGAVDGQFPSRSESGSEDVALRMLFGVLGADDAAFHQAAYVGMIAGETQDACAAHQVEAAIADVREIKLAGANNHGGAGGSHALKCRMHFCILLNAGVSRVEGLDERRLRIVVQGLFIHFANGLNGEAAGFLAAFVAAHAVCNHGESPFAAEFFVAGGLPIEVGILIVLALAAHVTEAGHFNSGFNIHAIDRHWFTTPAIIDKSSRERGMLGASGFRLPASGFRLRASGFGLPGLVSSFWFLVSVAAMCFVSLETGNWKLETPAVFLGERKKPLEFAAFVLTIFLNSSLNLGGQLLELLPIMLVFVDLLAGAILFAVELSLFSLGEVTVVGSHIRFFLVLDVLFPVLHTRGLSRRHGAVPLAVGDAVLLILLACIHFVDARMAGINLPRSGAGCVVVLGLSSGGTKKHETTHCED